MNLDEYLSQRGVDRLAVVASVAENVGNASDDILLGVGSVAEGLGTSKSDLDLLLITSGDSSQPDLQDQASAWAVGRCIVDFQTVRSADIEQLLARLDAWSQLPWNVSQAADFNYDERILLHRLLHGRQLSPTGSDERVAALRPSSSVLSRLKLQVARHMARTVQVDMVGYLGNRDYASLVFAGQELLGHAVDALLAGHQLTNPAPKWRSRLLDSLPSHWESELPVRPTGLSAGQRFWQLHRAPEHPHEQSSLRHAVRCTGFARAVFLWAEMQSTPRPAGRRTSFDWLPAQPQPREAPLPNLKLDVDFSLSGGTVTIARLNEFAGRVELSPDELPLFLLFDGATTAGEAERIVYGSDGGDRERGSLERTIARMAEAGLCILPEDGPIGERQ